MSFYYNHLFPELLYVLQLIKLCFSILSIFQTVTIQTENHFFPIIKKQRDGMIFIRYINIRSLLPP